MVGPEEIETNLAHLRESIDRTLEITGRKGEESKDYQNNHQKARGS